MTADQIALCLKLVRGAGGLAEISNNEFVKLFPSALESGKLSTQLLQNASRSGNSRELGGTLLVGFVFGFTIEQMDILIPLLKEDWHQSHEDVVMILDTFRTPKAIEAFFFATQWVPGYLDFDAARALAVKAIWGLGNLPGIESEEKLELLARSDVEVIRKNALNQLERRRKIA